MAEKRKNRYQFLRGLPREVQREYKNNESMLRNMKKTYDWEKNIDLRKTRSQKKSFITNSLNLGTQKERDQWTKEFKKKGGLLEQVDKWQKQVPKEFRYSQDLIFNTVVLNKTFSNVPKAGFLKEEQFNVLSSAQKQHLHKMYQRKVYQKYKAREDNWKRKMIRDWELGYIGEP